MHMYYIIFPCTIWFRGIKSYQLQRHCMLPFSLWHKTDRVLATLHKQSQNPSGEPWQPQAWSPSAALIIWPMRRQITEIFRRPTRPKSAMWYVIDFRETVTLDPNDIQTPRNIIRRTIKNDRTLCISWILFLTKVLCLYMYVWEDFNFPHKVMEWRSDVSCAIC